MERRQAWMGHVSKYAWEMYRNWRFSTGESSRPRLRRARSCYTISNSVAKLASAAVGRGNDETLEYIWRHVASACSWTP